MTSQAICMGKRISSLKLSRLQLHSQNIGCLNSNRLMCSQNHKSDKSIGNELTTSTEKTKQIQTSEQLKDTDAVNRTKPVKYRRQDYPDPMSRVRGILYDEFKHMYDSTVYTLKGVSRVARGLDPISDQKEGKDVIDVNAVEKTNDEKLPVIKPGVEIQKKSTESAPIEHKNIIKEASELISKLKPPPMASIFPTHCDVLIIGGGAIGSSIAYHLKQAFSDGLDVVVLEKDPTYQKSSTVLSVGGIRQQFSLPENILLSMYGIEFMRDMPQLLAIEGQPPPSVDFHPHGYLTLASERGLQQLKDNLYVQQHFNARVKFMEPRELRTKFPWMNSDGLAGGVLGLENEGWFDPWSLLTALRSKAVHLGTQYVNGEAVDVNKNDKQFNLYCPTNIEERVEGVTVRLPCGELRNITPAKVVIAAGHATGDICYDMLGIGKAKTGLMAYPTPIEPRKRYVYSFHAPKGPGLATPLVVDPSGAYFRREGFGNMYIGGMSPTEDNEPPCTDLEVDHDYFIEHVWPVLAHRVKAFEEIKVTGSWAGFYEYNIFDQNGIVGRHTTITNLFLAAGFSGHGIQHSLGVGRAISELITDGKFKTIDLSRFQFERLPRNEPLYEDCIV